MEVFLGDFKFDVNEKHWSKISRVKRWKWHKEPDIRGFERNYYEGQEGGKYTLSGTVDARKHGGKPFKKLEDMADKGVPYILKDNQGYFVGKWIIASLSENSDVLNKNMGPDIIEFTLEIESYHDF